MSNKTNRPKAGDATGRKKAELEAQQAEAAEERQHELTMINQQKAVEVEQGVFDPVNGKLLRGPDDEGDPTPEAVEGSGSDDELPPVMDLGVEIAEHDEVEIRVNETLTNVTIGAGTLYNFNEGQKYLVPANVAFHLEEKGYVWH